MLEPGEEVQTSDPADSGQTYEPVQYRTLLQVSAALGLPYAYVSNDMLKANYSNSRLALLEFRRRIDATANAEAIAEREGCSVRKVNMTISLAFLAPDLVKAAIAGRLPHGMGVARLADLPAEWARQHQMLGLPSQ